MKAGNVVDVGVMSGRIVARWHIVAAVVLLAVTSVDMTLAQTVWDGGSAAGNDWMDGANWVGDPSGGPVSGITTDIQFAGSVRTSPSLDQDFTVKTLKFSSGASSFTVGGTGVISVQGLGNNYSNAVANASSNLQTINSSLKLLGATGFTAYNGDMTINGGSDTNGQSIGFMVQPNRTLSLNGVISGSTGQMAYNGTGTGTFVVSGVNTYTGNTYIWGGTVKVATNSLNGQAGAFGNGTSPIAVGLGTGSPTAQLVTSGAVTIGRSISLVSNTAGTTNYTIGGSTADVSTYSGTVFMTGGTAGDTAQPLTLTAASGGRVNFTSNLQRRGTDVGAIDVVTKTGSGIVALGGTNNNYSGNTNVNAGTLLVNGTLSASSSLVNVGAGATLGGTGTINRAVVVGDGGILAAGDISVAGVNLGGKLTLGSGLTLSSLSTINFDLAAAASTTDDLIAITGDLALNGTLNVTALSGFDTGIYTLFTYTGNRTGAGLAIGTTMPSGFDYQIDTSTNGIVNLIVTVPEPSSTAFLGASLILYALSRCRRKI